ncbi:MAG: rane protein of unknown function [Candidatus Saccharibacteria bacterium]|nr:rane protein of unknown function [Candidatus Saccharibacteria bacterium]
MATKKTASSKKSVATTKAKSNKVTTVKAVSATSSNRLPVLGSVKTPQVSAAVAEFVGTFILAAAVIASQGQPVLVLFALVGAVLAVGAASGAHLNPAITVAAWATRKMTAVRALVYIVAQVLGAMLALVVLNAFVGQAPDVSSQASMLGQGAQELFKATAIPAGKEWTLILAELMGAAIFGFAFASARKQVTRLSKAFTIGLGFFLALLVAGSAAAAISGMTILNPAVAVALQAIDFNSVWPVAIYVLATVVGAAGGFVLNDLLGVDADA